MANPSTGERVRTANRWREVYNPLRNLDLQRAVALIEAAQRGEYADLMWTYGSPWTGIEIADPDLLALIERSHAPLLEMDYEVQISEDVADRPELARMAQEQQQALEGVYEQVHNLYELVEHLALARFRGFAFAQPLDGTREQSSWSQARHIALLDQWNFVRDGLNGDWYWNPEARQVSAVALGPERRLDLATLIFRARPRHINRYGLFKFVRSLLSEKDWDGFIEIFGIEQPIITLPTDTPEDKVDDWFEQAENAADGGGGVVPGGSTVTFPGSGVRGSQPFSDRLRYLTERLILAGTGGQLTMLTSPGSGTLAGGAHSETFKQIARGEARRISETMQRQFDRRVLAELFPGQPVLAYFNLQANEEVDTTKYIANVVNLAGAGYITPEEDLRETTGMNVVYRAPAPQIPGMVPTRVTNRAPAGAERDQMDLHLAILRDTMQEAQAAEQKDLAPLLERVQQILAIDDPRAFAVAMGKLIDDSPTFVAQLREQGSALADVFEHAMAAELFNGIAEGVKGAGK